MRPGLHDLPEPPVTTLLHPLDLRRAAHRGVEDAVVAEVRVTDPVRRPGRLAEGGQHGRRVLEQQHPLGVGLLVRSTLQQSTPQCHDPGCAKDSGIGQRRNQDDDEDDADTLVQVEVAQHPSPHPLPHPSPQPLPRLPPPPEDVGPAVPSLRVPDRPRHPPAIFGDSLTALIGPISAASAEPNMMSPAMTRATSAAATARCSSRESPVRKAGVTPMSGWLRVVPSANALIPSPAPPTTAILGGADRPAASAMSAIAPTSASASPCSRSRTLQAAAHPMLGVGELDSRIERTDSE